MTEGGGTLQRILAEVVTHAPEIEILLLMFRFEHSRMFISSGGDLTLEPAASIEEERKHLATLSQTNFSRAQRVALAEAGLIQHFRPPYNDVFMSTNFAAKKRLTILRDLDAKGVTGLIVEICTSNIRARLKSKACPPTTLESIFPTSDALARATEALKSGSSEMREQLESMLYNQTAKIALTTSEQRNTFLHGMKWANP